jgi:hypothetical protein
LEKWLNLLEGYYSVQKNSNIENITFSLLKSIPCVKDWCKCNWKRHKKHESTKFGIGPIWEAFFESFKEEFYPISNYDDHSPWPKIPPMVEEKRDDRVGYPFNIFLEESLM